MTDLPPGRPPFQGLDYKTPRQLLDEIPRSEDPRVIGAMEEVNRRMTDIISFALGISPSLLMGEAATDSRSEFEARHNEYKNSFMQVAKQIQEAFPKPELWNPETYFILYLNRRPRAVLCGSGS